MDESTGKQGRRRMISEAAKTLNSSKGENSHVE